MAPTDLQISDEGAHDKLSSDFPIVASPLAPPLCKCHIWSCPSSFNYRQGQSVCEAETRTIPI